MFDVAGRSWGNGRLVGIRRPRVALGALGLLLSAAFIASCGNVEDAADADEVETRSGALTAAGARVLGFETPQADWTVIWGGQGTITASPIHTEGSFSLAINARNFVPVQSVKIESLGPNVGSTVSYDLRLPPEQPNQFWFGTTQLYINLPSQGISNAFIGQVELTGKPLSQFVPIQYTLPANIVTALRATYNDLQVIVVINVPFNATGTYRIDNLQFAGASPPVPPVNVVQISSDPLTNAGPQHATQVEPDSFSFGSTIVAVTQTGRFADTGGGATAVSFATSTNNGGNWVTGLLPNITTVNGGAFDRVSDPTIAFDSRHDVWIAVTLGIRSTDFAGSAILASRSTNGGLNWDNPVTVASAPAPFGYDKSWVACDNTSTSPFFGNCYATWDDASTGETVLVSTSSNGGLNWSTPIPTANGTSGVGGQPLALPNGTAVIVVPSGLSGGTLLAFRSTNGGASWDASVSAAAMMFHPSAGNIRSESLPSAEIDGGGRIYVAWPDCSFRTGCTANDIVTTSSTDGLSWTTVARVPIDAATSTVDHFIPGLGVDRATSGAGAHLGLAYYFYPNTSCTAATCELNVGFISSTNGGAAWGTPTTLAGPMNLSWIAASQNGQMVGDYISTSFAGGSAHPIFAAASAPVGGVFSEGLFTATITP